MSDKSQDRRVQRTKRLIWYALTELLNQKDIKSITVKDVADAADINRSTFYLHYRDIPDLVSQIEDEHIGIFVQTIYSHQADSIETLFNEKHLIIHQLLDYIYNNIDMCRVLFLNSYGTMFQEKFQNILIQVCIDLYKKNYGKQYNEYLFCFISSGMIGIMKNWFHDDCRMNREDLAQLIIDLVEAVWPML